MVRILLLCLLLAGCGAFEKHSEKEAHDSRVSRLKEKVSEVTSRYLQVSDQDTHWPSVTDCDSLLWSSLAAASGVSINLSLAESSPGHWERRPSSPCWTPELGEKAGSKSTISNDMLAGLIWALWRNRDLGALQRLGDYGESHSFVMGEPSSAIGEVVLKPYMMGLLGDAIYKLSGGKDDRVYRNILEAYLPSDQDYVQHLQALAITLHGEIDSAPMGLVDINGDMLTRLEDLVSEHPDNPGFQTALGVYTGDQEKALDLLISDDTPIPSYIRGDNPEAFWLSEWLFWSSVLLKHAEG